MKTPEPNTGPDYRFTLANERTFLAWIRTALALVAGGLGAIHLLPESAYTDEVGLLLLGMAFVTAVGSYRRWSLIERAILAGHTLPRSRIPQFISYAVAIVAVAAVVLFVSDAITT